MWAAFFLWIGTSIVSALLTKAPKGVSASAIDSDQVPTAQEGKPLYIVLGTCKISGPNVTWWGNVKTESITKETDGFFGIGAKSYTVGHRYFVGMQMGLCSGPIDSLVDILIDGKSLDAAGVSLPVAYSALGSTIVVNCPELFGGEESEGGIVGTISFYFGSSTQLGNPYLAGAVGKVVPGYRDVCYATLHQIYIGTQAYLKNWAWVLRGCPCPTGMSPTYANIAGDCNAAHGIAYLLTEDKDQGCMGISLSRLDLVSFNACAQTLYTEGLGISVLLDTSQNAETWIAEILETVDAVLYTDPQTGLWTMNLIRNDYVEGDLLEFTEADISGFERSLPSWPETLNRVVVEYTSRADDFVTKTVQDMDLANKSIQGVDSCATLSFPAISNATNAQAIAGRERRTHAYPLALLKFICNRKAWALRPGSPFKISWSPLGIAGLICRVTTIRYGSLEEGQITLEAVEDIFGVMDSAYEPPVSEWTDPLAPPAALAYRGLFEAPYWINGESRDVLVYGARGDTTTTSMDVWTDAGSGYLNTASAEPSPTGTLTAAWSAKTPALDSVGFTVGTGIDLSHLPEQSTNADGRNRGVNLGLVGSELFSWTTCTDNGDGTYTLTDILRGILDTVPEEHALGARVWFLSGRAVLSLADNTSDAGGGTGTPGAVGVDGRSYIWHGPWDPAHTYAQDDTCSRNGSSYVALQASLNQDPALDTAHLYWDIMALAGTNGVDGVSTFTRTIVNTSTAILAPGYAEDAALTMKCTANILNVSTDYPARIRMYNTSASRAADSGRAITEDYAPGSGCFFDIATAAGALSVDCSPVPVFVNGDSPVVDVAYLSIVNLDTVSRAITTSIEYLPLEA